jgi:hypothetical protein
MGNVLVRFRGSLTDEMQPQLSSTICHRTSHDAVSSRDNTCSGLSRDSVNAQRHVLRYLVFGFLIELLNDLKLLIGGRRIPQCLIQTA